MQAFDLARTHVEHAFGAACEDAAFYLRFSCYQVFDLQIQGRELGNEAVGGCGHHHQIARIGMFLHQRDGRRWDAAHDLRGQKRLAQRLPLRAAAASQRAHVKAGELLHAHCARFVARFHIGIAGGKLSAVQHALLNQELAPQHITVARQEGVVQIE